MFGGHRQRLIEIGRESIVKQFALWVIERKVTFLEVREGATLPPPLVSPHKSAIETKVQSTGNTIISLASPF